MKKMRPAAPTGRLPLLLGLALCVVIVAAPLGAWAHCDTLDGPVVADARAALEKGDVTPVLKWVHKDDEAAVRQAFKETLTVRAKGPEAKDLADRYFFETLVRVHRAGEGAPYTGLKPAGTADPGIAAADKALETGSLDALRNLLAEQVASGLKSRFAAVLEASKHKNDSVAAGREFVEAYVAFVHYAEGVLGAALTPSTHGADASPEGEASAGPSPRHHTHQERGNEPRE